MVYRRDPFDDDFASPADREDGFTESDAVRCERQRRRGAAARMRAMAKESGRDGSPDRVKGPGDMEF